MRIAENGRPFSRPSEHPIITQKGTSNKGKPTIALRCDRPSSFGPHDRRALSDRVHGLEIVRASKWVLLRRRTGVYGRGIG